MYNINDEEPELTDEEKAEKFALVGLLQHPGWEIFVKAAEETLYSLMTAYYSMSLKETTMTETGRTIQKYRTLESMAIEQAYLRGRIDQLKDTLYVYQEQTVDNHQQRTRIRDKVKQRLSFIYHKIIGSV